ncbi:hypothetical protein GE09DRAFT_1046446 [Coniochaeta sp. 2T2.1]|nr:hypothetical protein GE09DRAFT_1046446 [Coniochaeta sp. 2T2.1]
MARLSNVLGLASLVPLAASKGCIRPNITRTVAISPTGAPATNRQVVDAAFQSYSVEFCYMADYAGNDTNPNTFSRQLIQNLYDVSGAYPIIRVGGSTQNSAVYYPDQTEAIIDPFSSPSADQPGHSYLGLAWLQSFNQFPEGTQYTLFKVGNGLAQCVLEADAVYKSLGDSLYAFEIGNEVDGWPGGSRRSANWTIQDYVTQWNQYAEAISQNLTGQDDMRIFQGCAFEAPRHVGDDHAWNVENAERDGMLSNRAKTVSDHEYMGANCHYTGIGPTIESSLFDRSNMLSRVWYHDYLGNATAGSGIPYVVGETNSISCQGAFNISDVMASAVWAVDYVLYLSATRVSRVHFHMGTRYRYSPWIPVTYNDTAPHVNPLYYGNLFNAAVFAGGEKQTEVLVNETRFGAYAVYGAGKLESIVAVNLNMWNSTADAAQRPYTALTLPAGWEQAKVTRLTNPGVDVAANITIGGQYVDEHGNIVGDKRYGRVVAGKVLVGAGEAVMVRV